MCRRGFTSGRLLPLSCCAGLALFMAARPVASGPVPGFLETWPGTSTQTWVGGSTYSNPGTGGTGGAGDGYLKMSVTFPTHLGTANLTTNYAGDWIAAGITAIKVWLNDVNLDQLLEIHFSLGNVNNFWQYNEGFLPPENAWGEFTVDLSSESGFTLIRGAGTFLDALRTVDRIHFRHDLAPYTGSPNSIMGEVGIDHLQLLGGITATRANTWGRLKALYR